MVREAEQERLKSGVSNCILNILRTRNADFLKVLSACNGADPHLVNEILGELVHDGTAKCEDGLFSLAGPTETPNWSSARTQTLTVMEHIPPANPVGCQWWFDLDTLLGLAMKIWAVEKTEGLPAAFLGTPLLGYFYLVATQEKCTIFDKDEHLLEVLSSFITKLEWGGECLVRAYDVCDDVPSDLECRYSVVVMDPPWYMEMFDAFLYRGRKLGCQGAHLLCALPGRLTRPGAGEERNQLIKKMLDSEFDILSLDSGLISYSVPKFEAAAYRDIAGFDVRSWRIADLLVARYPLASEMDDMGISLEKDVVKDFWRGNRRFFLRPNATLEGEGDLLEEVESFGRTVSSRDVPLGKVGFWTEARRGFQVRCPEVIESLLVLWVEGKAKEEALQEVESGYEIGRARLEQLCNKLQLWSEEEKESWLRKGGELEKCRRAQICERWAKSPSPREYQCSSDMFRLDFQRDRDRIVWSKALNRLAGKTQIFPIEYDEHSRCRLTHTLTVRQLSSTVANAFGLDMHLTEGIALAHDIGHTPFGHPGEEVINKVLNVVDERLKGFNHYEHGVDVLRWLEDAYLAVGAGQHPGLNLCPEVYEGVFKHMFNRMTGTKSQSDLYHASKHQDVFEDDYCHLEGQAVRAVDKISYLVEDLEEGLRARVLTLDEIRKCRLFSRSPIDMRVSQGETELERFISQRRAILSVLMNDLLEETERRLMGKDSVSQLREAKDYCVANSQEIAADVSEVWRTLQVGSLHKDQRIQGANVRAATVVRELMCLFVFCPDTVDRIFSVSYEKAINMTKYYELYKKRIEGEEIVVPRTFGTKFEGSLSRDERISTMDDGTMCRVPLMNILQAKDFVATLTDERALRMYRGLIRGEVPFR